MLLFVIEVLFVRNVCILKQKIFVPVKNITKILLNLAEANFVSGNNHC